MRIALVNPAWSFDGSIYFGCREAHLPLELGYAHALLDAEGHDVEIIDGQLEGLATGQLRDRIAAFAPEAVVLTTAPSYLFWRCPPPELRVPRQTADSLRDLAPTLIVVGPHASTTPASTLAKLGAQVAVLGECEEVLAALARTPRDGWGAIPGVALRDEDGQVTINGGPQAADVRALPPLRWPVEAVQRHTHHHHRFDAAPVGPGAEMEASRGCPYHCTFCAKDNYRDRYRKRPLATVLAELDHLKSLGTQYVYFIDEIFLPDESLLRAIAQRDIEFGVQTRIDLWSFELLDLLGAAGCRSIEAGVESISPEGRARLDKRCRLSTDEISALLLRAKRTVPFVQATLMESKSDDARAVEAWRAQLAKAGVWSNAPVPLFPYPGSPEYLRRWGRPDEQAWERAHQHYLAQFHTFSDVQEQRPISLPVLEGTA